MVISKIHSIFVPIFYLKVLPKVDLKVNIQQLMKLRQPNRHQSDEMRKEDVNQLRDKLHQQLSK